jgi:hypothetical protein
MAFGLRKTGPLNNNARPVGKLGASLSKDDVQNLKDAHDKAVKTGELQKVPIELAGGGTAYISVSDTSVHEETVRQVNRDLGIE